MAVVQLQPDLSNPALNAGYDIPRGSGMRSVLGKDDTTACEYRTPTPDPVAGRTGRGPLLHPWRQHRRRRCRAAAQVKAGLRLRLRTTNGAPFNTLRSTA
jgi:type VI secretion system protein ImpG